MATKRNALGTIIYKVPTSEKMEGDADTEYGAYQIKEKSRAKMPVFWLIFIGFILFVISRSSYIDPETIISYYIYAGSLYAVICILTFLYLKNTYIIYYEKGMYIHTIIKRTRFSYSEIIDIKGTVTSYNGSSNGVESYKLILSNHDMITVSGFTYKYVNWHITTLLKNLYIGDDQINLLTGEVIPSQK